MPIWNEELQQWGYLYYEEVSSFQWLGIRRDMPIDKVDNIVPDSFVPLKGWRLFRAKEDYKGLLSLSVPYNWDSIQPKPSECLVYMSLNIHKSPCFQCSCGYYAFKDKEEAILESERLYRLREQPIIGLVEMWGRIIIHEMGYRSEHIKITELYVCSHTSYGHVKNLDNKYSVPINIIEGSDKWPELEYLREKYTLNQYPNPYPKSFHQNPYQLNPYRKSNPYHLNQYGQWVKLPKDKI